MLLSLFKNKGLDFTLEDNDRVFPNSHDSHDILKILQSYLEDVHIQYNFNVKKISEDFIINNKIKASKIIIATGGVTYPQTGTSFANYNLTPHKKTPIKYGLAPIKTIDNLSHLSGIVLEDVLVNNKIRGNVLITHFGLTGPAILNITNTLSDDKSTIKINLLPDLTQEMLTDDFLNAKGKQLLKNFLKQYLPNNFVNYFINKSSVKGDVSMSNLRKKDRNKIITNLMNFPFEISGINKDLSKITIGGIDTDYVNPKTLESKIIDNLYFAGEVLDLHGPTGGYNLKLAFSTGYLAGLSASK